MLSDKLQRLFCEAAEFEQRYGQRPDLIIPWNLFCEFAKELGVNNVSDISVQDLHSGKVTLFGCRVKTLKSLDDSCWVAKRI